MKSSKIYRMNPSGKKDRKPGTYTILDDEENQIDFHDVELAPPSGFFAANYTR